MKTVWPLRALGDILEPVTTTNPLQYPERHFCYVDVSSISNKTFQIQAVQKLKGKDAPSRARRLIKANDVLFATVRPTLQRLALVPAELDNQVCSTGFFVLRANETVDQKFIFYFLQTESFRERMRALQRGASYPAVTDGDIKAQPFPHPPLPEQQRIVGILDKAFESIATAKTNTEKNIVNARELFQIALSTAFDSLSADVVTAPLSDITAVPITYGVVKPGPEGTVPFIRGGDISNGTILTRKLRTITDAISKTYKRTLLNGGELLISLVGQPGQVAVVPESLRGANIARQVGLIVLNTDAPYE